MNVMNETTPSIIFPSFRNFFWACVLLCLFGWGGLAILVVITLPTMGPRWLFYFLLMCGVSGLALPVTYFINRRFMSKPPAEGGVIVRQAIWIGFYACTMIWMRSGGFLNPVMALALALGFLAVEVLLRIREMSLWKPKGTLDE
jgi:hypothetical protein